jgi:exosortase/archaeosortase family protein
MNSPKKIISVPFFKEFIKNNKRLCNFLIRLSFLILLWKIVFHFIWHTPSWLEAYNAFSIVLIGYILEASGFLLELLGQEVFIDYSERLVGIVGTTGVEVGEPCIGYNTVAFFIALILSDTGKVRIKLWFIPLGIFVICLFNLMRIAALGLIIQIDPTIWELNHKFIFKIIIFGVLFLFWMIWLNNYSSMRKLSSK